MEDENNLLDIIKEGNDKPKTKFVTNELKKLLLDRIVFFPENDYLDRIYLRVDVILSKNYCKRLAFVT